MTYSAAALARRRCLATRRDGQPCGAWALWDPSAGQRCVNHAGRHRRGSYGGPGKSERTHNPNCVCAAYPFPHRPGGGACRWPEEPFRPVSVRRRREPWEAPMWTDLPLGRYGGV